MKRVLVFVLFLILVLVPSSASVIDVPTVDDDVTIIDEYVGAINNTHPMYYGEIQIFYGQKIWYAQKGGVHNWGLTHVVFDDNPYVKSVRNALFDSIENRVVVYPNQTIVTLSNGSVLWLENEVCPVCNHTMHAAEFSDHGLSLFWFCDSCRLILGILVDSV
jgi:hypothetical protein